MAERKIEVGASEQVAGRLIITSSRLRDEGVLAEVSRD
jgi:hypothetical protein